MRDTTTNATTNATAELRWFFERSAPQALAVWFHSTSRHAGPAGGGRLLTDTYLLDACSPRASVRRGQPGAGLLVKMRASVDPRGCQAGPFEGDVEVWVKGRLERVSSPGLTPVDVVKRRWRRLFDAAGPQVREVLLDDQEVPIGEPLPATGCFLELTNVEPDGGGRWVTLAFEAFGAIETLSASLLRTAADLAQRGAPGLDGPFEGSYPAWLPRALP